MDESTMLLNINTTDEKTSSKVKLRKNTPTNQRARLNMRKWEKLSKIRMVNQEKKEEQEQMKAKKNSESKSGNEGKSDKQSPSEKPADKTLKTRNTASSVNSNTNSRVISSLFNKNPQIPSLPHSNVKQNTEILFTHTKFSELNIHPHLVSCLEKMSFSEMTEVQKKSIPHLLNYKDCMIKSQTGSGKTLAYAVPLLQALRNRERQIKRSDGVYCIILLPTRELALQTLATLNKLVQSCIWIVPGVLIGGESKKSEKSRLRKGINILVATPGRLVDHMQTTTCLNLSHVESLIIDEADRLLDMGFEKELSIIFSTLRDKSSEERQTVLLSATLSLGVKSLATEALREPITIDIATPGTNQDNTSGGNQKSDGVIMDTQHDKVYSLPSSLKQYYLVAPSKLRLVTLAALILNKLVHSSEVHKMIVFLPSQEVVQFYFDLLDSTINRKIIREQSVTNIAELAGIEEEEEEEENCRFEMFALHGDMEQKYRTSVFREYKSCKSGVLLCTDVAARGLDLPKVDWVIQYTAPSNVDDYIHRVGRTARIGSKGSAVLFLLPTEVKYINQLNDQNISLQEMGVDSILQTCLLEVDRLPCNAGSGRRQLPNTYEEAATALQQSLEEWTNKTKQTTDQAKSAFQSFVRAYATYPSTLKSIFHVKFLHLGHLAKSFCLREAPSNMKGAPVSHKRKHKSKFEESRTRIKKVKVDMSEFASGL